MQLGKDPCADLCTTIDRASAMKGVVQGPDVTLESTKIVRVHVEFLKAYDVERLLCQVVDDIIHFGPALAIQRNAFCSMPWARVWVDPPPGSNHAATLRPSSRSCTASAGVSELATLAAPKCGDHPSQDSTA